MSKMSNLLTELETRAHTTGVPLVHLTPSSGNSKTGEIPVTYRPMTTCEPTCPFLPTGEIGGCYGTGRIFALAQKYSRPWVSFDELRARLAKGLKPSARFLRDRVVGDVIADDGSVDHDYVGAIAALAHSFGLIPFGYSHAWRRFTREDIRRFQDIGYVMNASCETREDIREAINLGMPVTIASDHVDDGETFTAPDGSVRRIVTCPAQTRESVTCASCGLCARGNRAAVVRFHIHGTARKRAEKAVTMREDAGR